MDGFYFTPNINIPLNKREPGTIADVAWEQLKRFRIAAETWPIYRHYRDGRHCMVCRFCDQCVWFVMDPNGKEYEYTDDDIRSVIIAHVRQIHSDIVDEKGAIIDENSRERQILDRACDPNTLSVGGSNAHRFEHQSGDSRGIEYT